MSDKYITYGIEDWILDDDFINYAIGKETAITDTISDLLQDPNQSAKIKEAISIVRGLNSAQISISDAKIHNLFQDINNTIDKRSTSNKKPSTDKKSSKLFIRRAAVLTAVAASLALLLIFNPFASAQEQSYATEIGEQIHFDLPDQSQVDLNTASSLYFDRKEWSNSRTLELEGEAFFKVKKGSKFTVLSKQGSVSVLGTEFNVYARGTTYEVECIEGRVQVDLENGQQYILTAGDRLSNKMGRETKKEEKVVQKVDWLNQYVEMESKPLGEVLEEVSRYYEVEFEKPEGIDTITYAGFFTTNSLDSAMLQILWPLGIVYERKGSRIILSKTPE